MQEATKQERTMRKLKSERSPGRPKNTGRHQAHDACLLPKIADRKLENPHQSLAAIITGLITARDTGGIRRLQRAFKAQGDSLLTAAKQRRQKRQFQEAAEKIEAFARGVHQVADALSTKLDAWIRSPEGRMQIEAMKRFEQAMNTPEARRTITLLSNYQPPRLGV